MSKKSERIIPIACLAAAAYFLPAHTRVLMADDGKSLGVDALGIVTGRVPGEADAASAAARAPAVKDVLPAPDPAKVPVAAPPPPPPPPPPAPPAPKAVEAPPPPPPAPEPPKAAEATPPSPPPVPAPAPRVEEPAPVSTGGQGVTQFYGYTDGSAPAPAWLAEASMNPDYSAAPEAAAAPAPAEAPAAAAVEPPAPAPRAEEPAPVSTGGQGVTQFYGSSDPAAPAPGWLAEASMNPDYTADAAVPPPVPAAEPAAPAPAARAEEPAPVSTGGQGVTQFYGSGDGSEAHPAWAAEARMNPDYNAAPAAAPAPVAAPAASPAQVETCRDALNAEIEASKLHFHTSSAEIMEEDIKTLDTLAKIAKDCGNVVIEVGGHTDSTGPAYANKILSQERANAVVSYLAKAGVDEARLKATGYGPDKPIGDNSTAQGRQKNRRIEFLVTGN